MHFFQVSVTITNEKSVSTVLSSVARNLLKTDVTWGKIASLYCVAGGLAIDCVQQGHPEYLYGIVETMGLVIERDAATWIAQQGGWVRFYGIWQKRGHFVYKVIFFFYRQPYFRDFGLQTTTMAHFK